MGRLSSVIELAIDAYYSGGLVSHNPLLDYGDLSAEMQQKLEKLTIKARQCAQDLTALDGLPYGVMKIQLFFEATPENYKDYARIMLVHLQKLEEEIGRDLASMASEAEDRIFDLAEMALQERPSDKAAAFLKRVARCYLFGFDAECLIMCRSVIDAELDREISGDDCIKAFGYRNLDLNDRIEAARRLQRLSFELAQEAHSIRKLCNKAVHGDPDVAKGVDVLDIIGNTLRIIRALNPEGNGKEEA